MKYFSQFLGTRDRENKEHLEVLQMLLSKAGFEVMNHTGDHDDPFIFVRKPSQLGGLIESLSFNGVRVYTRGRDIICFRAANKEASEPYGSAYQLDIKGMFKALLGETHKKEKVGHQLTKYIIEEFKNFFIKSAEAEKDEKPEEKGPMGSATVNASGADFSANMVNDPRNTRN